MNFNYVENLLVQRAMFLNNPNNERLAAKAAKGMWPSRCPGRPDGVHPALAPHLSRVLGIQSAQCSPGSPAGGGGGEENR